MYVQRGWGRFGSAMTHQESLTDAVAVRPSPVHAGFLSDCAREGLSASCGWSWVPAGHRVLESKCRACVEIGLHI